jgi:hypothetical protein
MRARIRRGGYVSRETARMKCGLFSFEAIAVSKEAERQFVVMIFRCNELPFFALAKGDRLRRP